MNSSLNEVRILLVEDSASDALLIQEALCDIPDFVSALTHVELLSAGIARASEAPFDIVLLDLGLPDAQGFDTFRTFHKRTPELPVLVLTGLTDLSVGLSAIQEGAQDYLLKKEIEASLLSRAIRYAMERHRIAAAHKRDEEALRISREELRHLSAHIQHIREEEKTRIARELHDDLGQQLTALKMAVTLMDHSPQAYSRSPASDLCGIYALIDQLIESVRRIAADLRPTVLDDLGLIPAIEWLVSEFSARYHIRVTPHIDMQGIVFNHESRIELFRIVQEALTNVARHSGASEVVLEIVRDGPHCILRIVDNGRGTMREGQIGRRSFGLIGMRERAALLGGEIQIRTAPGSGFALTAILPLATVEAKWME